LINIIKAHHKKKNYRKFQTTSGMAKAKAFAVEIYTMTREAEGFNEDYRFKDQIIAAAVSVPSNIAEGNDSRFITGLQCKDNLG
jgi:hypothetical protein